MALAPARPNFTTVAPAWCAPGGAPRASCGSRRRCLWRRRGAASTFLFNPGFTSPVYCACPQVTVFHDLQYKRHPEYFTWLDLQAWRALLPLSAWLSDAVIAVSEATAADLRLYYRMPPRKLRVIPHGVDEQCFEAGRRRRPEPYFFDRLHAPPAQKPRHAAARLRRVPATATLFPAGTGGHARLLRRFARTSAGGTGAGRPRWISPAGFPAKSFTTSMRGPSRSSTHRALKASECRCWRRSRRAFPRRAPISLRCVRSAAAPRCTSTPWTPLRLAMRWRAWRGDEMLRRSLAEAGPPVAMRYTWQASAQATLETLAAAAARVNG